MSNVNDLISGFINHEEFLSLPPTTGWKFDGKINPQHGSIANEVISGLVQYLKNTSPAANIKSTSEIGSCGTTFFRIEIVSDTASNNSNGI